ncbi:MAG: hypothetical protein BBJ57_02435 [Desulfobacterales bacterium PC51MH44]|nr:MAG: hypothetical protein BBJ57_02435 [Desulfobacterales bacterium PC51MH44]
MTDVLKILATKMNDPRDIFIYLFIVFLFMIIMWMIKLLFKLSNQMTKSVELLNILVYRNEASNGNN